MDYDISGLSGAADLTISIGDDISFVVEGVSNGSGTATLEVYLDDTTYNIFGDIDAAESNVVELEVDCNLATEFRIDVSGNEGNASIAGQGVGLINWGDGDSEAVSGVWSVNHTYDSGSEFTVKVYGCTQISFANSYVVDEVIQIAEGIVSLEINSNNIPSLPSLPSTLNSLTCGNNQLTALPALPASLLSLFCNANMLTSLPDLPPLLNTLNASQNNLPVSDINEALADLVAGGTLNGTVALSGQTPAAPPSGAGIADKAILISNGWTVTTD